MKNKLLALGLILSCACATGAQADPLTVDTVIALAKSGIGDEAIIAKLRADGTQFDLTADQMIALRQSGVSSPVLAAMMTGSAPAKPALSVDSLDPMVPHPAGVYLVREAKMEKLNPTMSNQAKTGGMLGYAFTAGIASLSIKAAIPNETAKTATTARPTFYFFFDQALDAQASTAWAAGSNMTVSSPAEFTLIALEKKKGRREARVGSANIAGAKTGVMDKDRIPFDYTEVRPGVFKVEATNVATPGEYGFIFALGGGGGNAAGAMTARIFDFSVH